jgi:hypothetical protein
VAAEGIFATAFRSETVFIGEMKYSAIVNLKRALRSPEAAIREDVIRQDRRANRQKVIHHRTNEESHG